MPPKERYYSKFHHDKYVIVGICMVSKESYLLSQCSTFLFGTQQFGLVCNTSSRTIAKLEWSRVDISTLFYLIFLVLDWIKTSVHISNSMSKIFAERERTRRSKENSVPLPRSLVGDSSGLTFNWNKYFWQGAKLRCRCVVCYSHSIVRIEQWTVMTNMLQRY